MRFDTYISCDLLKPYVQSFAISEADEANAYKVLPDTGVVIGFQYHGNLAHIHDGQEIPLAVSGITGLQDTYRVFKNAADTGTVLVYFKEAGAGIFFREPDTNCFVKVYRSIILCSAPSC